MVKRLAFVGTVLELPALLEATKANVPVAEVPMLKLMVAEAPVGSITGGPKLAAGGLVAGARANVESVRLTPVTVSAGNLALGNDAPSSADFRLMDVITGTGNTVKLVVLVAVCPETVTETGPVVAPEGTVTVRVVAVAESAGAGVPLNWTASLAGVGSNAWP